MSAEDYFSFFNIPVSINLDKAQLKKEFFKKSRESHPDLFINGSEEEQQNALVQTAFINDAYKTLKGDESRLLYVLRLNGSYSEGEKYALPPMFLMEMMELNEAVMDLQMDPSASVKENVITDITAIEKDLDEAFFLLAQRFDNEGSSPDVLKDLKEIHFKRRYILRIRESLSKLALS